jgi:hypothetical protein
MCRTFMMHYWSGGNCDQTLGSQRGLRILSCWLVSKSRTRFKDKKDTPYHYGKECLLV